MQHIFVDFEMTCWRKGENVIGRKFPEIIDIGAVKMDENFQRIDTFCAYVRPEFTTLISKKCTDLTGITQADVSNAPLLSEVLKEFEAWIGTEDVKFYAWGGNDKHQLFNECREKCVYSEMPKLYRKWRNFQNIFMKVYGFSRKMKLIEAIETLGYDFEGRQHRAVYDAVNSARLLTAMKNREEHKKCIELLNKYYNKEESCTTSIGELLGGKLGGVNFAS